MSGGAASAKTTSYVLVAADAGTAISMTSTSATTITVNTGLFAAGDTVFIQNLGTANLTITAGTATVNTAGSLILPQYDAGILYFVSSSSAVFYDYIQTGAASPLTTKGDLYGFGTSDARIPIGSNNTVLTADSTETLGLKWAAPAGGGGMTFIKRASFSNVANTGTTFDDVFTSSYETYFINIENIFSASAGDDLQMQLRYAGPTTQTSAYYMANYYANYTASSMSFQNSNNASQWTLSDNSGDTNDRLAAQYYVNQVGNISERALINGQMINSNKITSDVMAGNAFTAQLYTGFLLKSSSANISGTITIFGVNKS
jgi:hypothetical protein